MDLHSVPPTAGGGKRSSGASSGRQHSSFDRVRAVRAAPRDCDIRLTLPARAENVALVRHVIGALGEAVALPPSVIEDMRLAVTEACTNVVRHAYRGTDGPLEITVQPEAGCLQVVVSDRGPGIVPNPESEGPGLGLPLIAALADELEIEQAPGRGSKLSMTFSAQSALEAA